MIIQTKTLQDNCKKILDAVDTGDKVSETLELEVVDQVLYLNVTNREYYVSVKTPLGADEQFHAVVDAKLFLNLISKLTTKEVDLKTTDTTLIVKSNGNYKIPLIYDEEGKILSLPRIEIENVTNSFGIKNSILQSILKYNSKELLKSGIIRDVQKFFYIDEMGALTFSGGACVNEFTLEQPINLFLTEKIIKLFKLFRSDVTFYIGQDMLPGFDKIVTKVAFTDGDVSLVSILNVDSSITNTFPVTAIRQLASASNKHTVTVNKDELLDSINRLLVFTNSKNGLNYTNIVFKRESMVVYDSKKDNYEELVYPNSELVIDEDYEARFNTIDLKLTLETCDEKYVNLSFGNGKAVVISRGNVKNIIPECKK